MADSNSAPWLDYQSAPATAPAASDNAPWQDYQQRQEQDVYQKPVKTVALPPSSSPQPKYAPDDSSIPGSYWRGIIHAIPGAERLEAASGATGAILGRDLGLNQTGHDVHFGDIYSQLLRSIQQQHAADASQNPVSNYYGQGAGTVLGLGSGAVLGGAPTGANFLTRALYGLRNGTAVGAAYGAGNAAPGDVVNNGITGAGIGAILGTAAEPIISLGSGAVKLGRGALEKLGVLDPVADQSANLLAGHAPQDVSALRDEATRQRSLGFQPTLVDITDEPGRRFVRAVASKPGSDAADTAVKFARDRRFGLDSEIGAAGAPISPISQPTGDVIDAVEGARKAVGDQQFEAVRNNPLPVTPDIKDALSTPDGQAAVRNAIRVERDPDTRKALGALGAYAKRQDDQFVPDASQQSVLDQLKALGPRFQDQYDQAYNEFRQAWQAAKPAPPAYTVGMAESIRKHLADATNAAYTAGKNTLGGSLKILRDNIRNHAINNSPDYGEALANQADLHSLRSGAEAGSTILSGSGDDFARTMRGVSDQPVEIPVIGPDGKPVLDEAGKVTKAPGPSPMDLARASARRTIEQKSNETPGAGIATATRLLTNGGDQRLGAIVPEQNAGRVQEGLETALKRVQNAQFINPNQGSQTQLRGEDVENMLDLAHAAHGVESSLRGNMLGVLRSVNHFSKRFGISSQEAGDLVSRATDPSQLDQLLDQLTQRTGSKATATQALNLARRAGQLITQQVVTPSPVPNKR